jgi:periplasmic divalent cation tolerance protein
VPANDKPVLIYGTFATPEEARRIGGELVDRHLAACVNILAPITSLYVWQGQREEATETPMLIKTRGALAQAVIAHVRNRHSYDNPALLSLAVEGGSEDFLAWIAAQTAAGTQGT